MIKRTIEISRQPAHLAVRMGQLLIKHGEETAASIPCEDIGLVMVDHPQTTYSHHALASLARCGATVVVCGPNHLPAAVLLPMADHSQVVWRIHDQLDVARPLKKRLWRQLVRAKIRAQAGNLPPDSPAFRRLLELAKSVRSGDPTNVEAQAARVYWGKWMPEIEFRRDVNATDVNGWLNYGYAVMRAAVARAVVAAGLVPALGLHHCNRSNSFCLADDLMEPFRPLVDHRVRELHRQGCTQLTQQARAALLELLTLRVRLADSTGPLMVSLHRMVASLVRCYCKQAKRLEIPQPCSSTGIVACG